MNNFDRGEQRDERIQTEIIVDAYTRDEQAMGWNIYLKETMDFPFEARYIEEREVSPLSKDETVQVAGVPRTEPSLRQQFVTVAWKGSELGVPLRQLETVDASKDTRQAIADWHY